MRRFRHLATLPLLGLLCACRAVVLSPSGEIAARQRDLVIDSTVLMLFVIVPVMALTVLFAWRYRQSNRDARYEPDWDHSTQLELVIWAAPLLIIICLGALTWVGTHLLDPYRPLETRAPDAALAAATNERTPPKPLRVNVVALDWKWLFIYPDYGVATVNELAAPVNTTIDMNITSSSVMNSLYIPALAGQVYAMPAMQTQLHAVMNRTGEYQGFSANYSGAGFSGMHFQFHSLTEGDFQRWIAAVKASGDTLGRRDYLELERPSENVPAHRYSTVDPGLYYAIVNMCVEAGKMCMSDMMAHDAHGGGSHLTQPEEVRAALEYDKYARRGSGTSTAAAGDNLGAGAGPTAGVIPTPGSAAAIAPAAGAHSGAPANPTAPAATPAGGSAHAASP